MEQSVADERGDAPPFDPMVAPDAGVAPAPPEFESAAPATEKQKFTGDWKCSMCGSAITSLPFEPRSTEGLKCIDCFKKSKT
jgi:CxxC-x17-CxxC domain-containing protein